MIGESKAKNLITSRINKRLNTSLLFVLIVSFFLVFSLFNNIQLVKAKTIESNQIALAGPPGGEDVKAVKEKASNANDLFSLKFDDIKNKVSSSLSPFFQKISSKIENEWSISLRPWIENHWKNLVIYLNKDIIIK